MDDKELCIRCGKPTPYKIHTPVDRRKYYVDGSGQLCEDCWKRVYGEIKTITLPTPTTPTLPDQEKYKELTSKDKLTPEDREELTRLYKKDCARFFNLTVSEIIRRAEEK